MGGGQRKDSLLLEVQASHLTNLVVLIIEAPGLGVHQVLPSAYAVVRM